MKISPRVVLLGVFLLGICHLWAQPFGLSNRVANTTLRFPSTLPTYGYRLTNAFGTMTFNTPIAVVTPPGETGRVFVVEQAGRIVVITNLASPTRTVFMDITARVRFSGEQGLLALAFHPGYATNRYFFVWYVSNTNGNQSLDNATRHDRLSRFEIDPANPDRGLPGSELILFQQLDEASNHNGGELQFGPDGYLYLSIGDEGGGNDQYNNSQTITKDFFSGLHRIDVDMRPESLPPNPHPSNTNTPTGPVINYAIPPDNPFVGATSFNGSPVDPAQVRTEFYAVGLRNPFRYSFDRETGLLYLGDVGQSAREEVDIIVKGGNYGWAYREGLIAGPKAPTPGFTSINPIQDYGRGTTATNTGNSITGGLVYRGDRIPHLYGAYVFADYVSGNIWYLRYSVTNGTTNIVPFVQILREPDIVSFGTDPVNKDILVVDQGDSQVKRLLYGPLSGTPIPATLAEAGVFSDMASLTPNAGILAYDVNTPYWTDNAIKSRWFCLPDVATKMTLRTNQPWSFPVGAVWVQHFETEMTNGVPESSRRLETRILVRDVAAANSAYGLTYRWTSATNADLVAETGLEESLAINDGGIIRTQTWQYPSRSDCVTCHNAASGRALGFNTPQLNRNHNYGGIIDNQIRALNNVGYFATSVSNIHSLIRMADLGDESYSAEYRARSYLMANCAHCHYPSSPLALGNYNARIYVSLGSAGIINGTLVNNLGNAANRVVRPGLLANSVMYTRIASTDPAIRMPAIGSLIPDQQALGVFERWIADELQSFLTFPEWQTNYFGATNIPNALALADFDGDGAENYLEYLTKTNPTNALDFWSVAIERAGAAVNVVVPQIANRGFEVQWTTNLMSTSVWRFLNVPENCPQFSSSNRIDRVPDTTDAASKTYRVRVYEH
jgi:glucose/arabinose dehydrogenase